MIEEILKTDLDSTYFEGYTEQLIQNRPDEYYELLVEYTYQYGSDRIEKLEKSF